MRRRCKRIVESILLFAIASVSLVSSGEKRHPKWAEVHFLARGTAIRSSWAGNQDIYLLELKLNHTSSATLAKLLDEYPSYAVPIAQETLSSQGFNKLKLRRSPECDTRLSIMLIRTAASDKLAILPEPLPFQPRLSGLDLDIVLPCFRVAR